MSNRLRWVWLVYHMHVNKKENVADIVKVHCIVNNRTSGYLNNVLKVTTLTVFPIIIHLSTLACG